MITDSQHYGDIADAIRAKLSSQDTYKPEDMADAVDTIGGGGGGIVSDNVWIEYKNFDNEGDPTEAVVHNFNEKSNSRNSEYPVQFSMQPKLRSVTGTENAQKIVPKAFCPIANPNVTLTGTPPYGAVNCNGLHLKIPFPSANKINAIYPYAFYGRYTTTADPDVIQINDTNARKIYEGAFCNFTGALIPMLAEGESLKQDLGDYTLTFPASSIFASATELFTGYQFKGCTGIARRLKFTGTGTVPQHCFEGCTEIESIEFQPDAPTNLAKNCLKDVGKNNVNFTKFWVKSGGTIEGTSASKAPFRGCNSRLEIWTDAVSDEVNWGTHWHKNNTLTSLTVHYGASYQDYLDA